MRYHELYGCLVATDLDLRLPETSVTERPAQVTLRRATRPVDVEWTPGEGEVLARVQDHERGVSYVAGRTVDGMRMRIDNVCQFDLSSDLSQVSWQNTPASDPGMVSVLAAGALMAFRLTMAGHLVLHSSAVLARGRGLAFVAASGMGKSSMATLLCAGGAKMITDDVGRVDFEGGDPHIWPGGGESRLRAAAASLPDLFGSEASARATSDGRTALLLPRVAGHPVPLDAIVVPLLSQTHDCLELRPVDAARALVLISQFPRLLGWVDAGVRKQQFDLLADLVDRVPVYAAVVPWRLPFCATIGTQLLDELSWPNRDEHPPLVPPTRYGVAAAVRRG